MHFAGLQTDMEEAKTQENKKLQQQLQELQFQSKETKDLLRREQENAKEALDKAVSVPEIRIDTTLADELTAENAKLKVIMIESLLFSLQWIHRVNQSVHTYGVGNWQNPSS